MRQTHLRPSTAVKRVQKPPENCKGEPVVSNRILASPPASLLFRFPSLARWGRAHRTAVERLREVVQMAGSQSALADSLGEPRSTISAWFGRKPRRATAEQLWTISYVYDVSLDWLFGFSVPMRRTDRERVGALRADLRQELLTAVKSRLPGALPRTVERSSAGPTSCGTYLWVRRRRLSSKPSMSECELKKRLLERG